MALRALRVNFAVRSETGYRRTNNEDNFFCNGFYMTSSERDRPFFLAGAAEVPCVFAVFDGMGGHDCGELASLMCAEILSRHYTRITAGSCEAVDAFVREAHRELRVLMAERSIITGTTMAMTVFGKNFFTAYNLGDSRIYSVKKGWLTRINDDHTVAEEMIKEGRLSPKHAEDSRWSNMLTKFIGMAGDESHSLPDVYGLLDYEENTRVLLCSDGLNKMLKHSEIAAIMKEAETATDAVNNLTESALRKGGFDNVTCIVIDSKKVQ